MMEGTKTVKRFDPLRKKAKTMRNIHNNNKIRDLKINADETTKEAKELGNY